VTIRGQPLADEEVGDSSGAQATRKGVAEIVKNESRELRLRECLFPTLTEHLSTAGPGADLGEDKPGEFGSEHVAPTLEPV
jgi:hypothetical protein